MPYRWHTFVSKVQFSGGRGGGPDGGPHDKGMHGIKALVEDPELAAEIGVTDEQVTKIKAILDESKDTRKARRDEMKEAHDALRDALDADPFDAAAARAAHAKMQALHAKAGNERFEQMVKIREVLTAEQHQALREKMQEMRGKIGIRKGLKRGGGGFCSDCPGRPDGPPPDDDAGFDE